MIQVMIIIRGVERSKILVFGLRLDFVSSYLQPPFNKMELSEKKKKKKKEKQKNKKTTKKKTKTTGIGH